MAKEKKTTSIDMTSGSPYRLILSFTMPLLLGNIFQQLYNIADSLVGTVLSMVFYRTSIYRQAEEKTTL